MWAFAKQDGELIPTTTVPLSDEDTDLLDQLIEELEANNEVQEVITNAE